MKSGAMLMIVDDTEIMELGLIWKTTINQKKTKHGPYMTSKTPKSTYFYNNFNVSYHINC